MTQSNGEITLLLASIRDGDDSAVDRLATLVYDELHAMARRLMEGEKTSHTLQPTALLNEAFLKLLNGNQLEGAVNRKYFFATAARAMRMLLVEHARRRKASKRGGRMKQLPFDELCDSCEARQLDVEALNNALDELSQLHERAAQVVTLRFLVGFTVEEVADQLGVSISSVESDFRFARAWLREQLSEKA